MESRIALFQKKEIRKTLHTDEWWFVIVDVVAALTDSANPAGYLKDMRRRDPALAAALKGADKLSPPLAGSLKGGGKLPPLALAFPTAGGSQKMACWHTEGIFRLIQSIPSPKAEPFKRWLAKVGYERVQEIENPELATKRIRAIYHAKGYSEAWIEKRMRSIAIRDELPTSGKNAASKRDSNTPSSPPKSPRLPSASRPPSMPSTRA